MEWDDHAHEDGPPRIRFSGRELAHLGASVAILTLCFTLVRDQRPFPDRFLPDPLILLGSLLAVGTGFVLHELAHKVVAQRYGHWAEFRAQFWGLATSYAVAALSGLLLGVPVLYAAPGAVLIRGDVTRRQNGLISLVGPAVNFLIAAAVWPFTWVTNADAPVQTVLAVIVFANAALAVFNLLPLSIFNGSLDGRKVLQWNGFVYAACLILAVALLVAILVGPGTLMGLVRH